MINLHVLDSSQFIHINIFAESLLLHSRSILKSMPCFTSRKGSNKWNSTPNLSTKMLPKKIQLQIIVSYNNIWANTLPITSQHSSRSTQATLYFISNHQYSIFIAEIPDSFQVTFFRNYDLQKEKKKHS